MGTAAILHNVLLKHDNLENDYTKTEKFRNDWFPVTEGENHDISSVFDEPATRGVVVTMQTCQGTELLYHGESPSTDLNSSICRLVSSLTTNTSIS